MAPVVKVSSTRRICRADARIPAGVSRRSLLPRPDPNGLPEVETGEKRGGVDVFFPSEPDSNGLPEVETGEKRGGVDVLFSSEPDPNGPLAEREERTRARREGKTRTPREAT